MSHEEARANVKYLKEWAHEGSSIYIGPITVKISNVESELQDYITQQEQHTATIRECIALLLISGENTKQAVIDKLRGCVE